MNDNLVGLVYIQCFATLTTACVQIAMSPCIFIQTSGMHILGSEILFAFHKQTS